MTVQMGLAQHQRITACLLVSFQLYPVQQQGQWLTGIGEGFSHVLPDVLLKQQCMFCTNKLQDKPSTPTSCLSPIGNLLACLCGNSGTATDPKSWPIPVISIGMEHLQFAVEVEAREDL